MRAALWLVSLFAVAVATALLASNNAGYGCYFLGSLPRRSLPEFGFVWAGHDFIDLALGATGTHSLV